MSEAVSIRWCGGNDTSCGEWGGSPFIHGDSIYTAVSSYSLRVVRTDLATGAVRWTARPQSKQSWPTGHPVAHGDSVYIAGNHGLYALSMEDGALKWLSKAPGLRGQAIIVDDLAFIAGRKALNAVSLSNGRKKWRFKYDGEVRTGVAYADGVLFVRNEDTLFALDAVKGSTPRWQTPSSHLWGAGPLVADGVVYFPVNYNTVAAADAATGEQRWKVSLTTNLHNSTPWRTAGDLLLIRDDDGGISALSRADGSLRWRSTTDDMGSIGSGGFAIEGGALYHPLPGAGMSGITKLRCISLADGTERWSVGKLTFSPHQGREPEPFDVSWHCTPAVRDGVIYAQFCNWLLALDQASASS